MSNVRVGVIGMGIMGSAHAADLLEGRVKRAELAAVCDPISENCTRVKAPHAFSNPDELLRSGLVDAVIIATPHYAHVPVGVAALELGLHVMVEKPIAVHKADADRLIAAHRDPKQVFATMFNLRHVPLYRRLKALVTDGDLGKLSRVQWTVTNCFRPQCYYEGASWRGTWSGEGGGVLLNQCPHQLDILQWVAGMPTKIWGFCKFGGSHSIEVEDEVTAYFEYANGATGIFVASTGEAPGLDRLELMGDRGLAVVSDGRLRFRRNEVGTAEFSRLTSNKFDKPPVWDIEIPVSSQGGEHAKLVENFVDAILDGAPLLAPAEEGAHSLELANAIVYSSWTGVPVTLPLDGTAYEACLKKKAMTKKNEN